MEIGLITPEREVSPFLRFTGPAHPVEGEFKSEVCGVVFDPSGTRMYCTSQRAHPQSPSAPGPGAVYEISGPFRQPLTPGRAARSGCPRASDASGPLRGGEGELRVKVRRRVGRRTLLRRGLAIEVRAPAGARVVGRARQPRPASKPRSGRHDGAAAHRGARPEALPRSGSVAATTPASGSGGAPSPAPQPPTADRSPARHGRAAERPPPERGAADPRAEADACPCTVCPGFPCKFKEAAAAPIHNPCPSR